MSTLQDVRSGLSRAWESLTIGWRELRELAGDALTRFHPRAARDEPGSSEEGNVMHRPARWGLLAAEVSDNGDSLYVTLEAPGLDPNDIVIEVRDDVLVVRGEKRISRERTSGHHYIMERAYGQFERAIRLPDTVKDDGATARYRSGVLSMTLPKARKHTANRIHVQT